MSSRDVRLPNKDSRRADALLTSLGYRFDRISSGAWVYLHPAAAPYHLHCTTHKYGHAAFKRVLTDMALRHPDKIKRSNASKPRAGVSKKEESARAEAQRKARIRAAERELAAQPVYEPTERDRLAREISRPTCIGCGRVWMSREIDPETHPCPRCGGENVVPINWEAA